MAHRRRCVVGRVTRARFRAMSDRGMDWLTENKIPVGDGAAGDVRLAAEQRRVVLRRPGGRHGGADRRRSCGCFRRRTRWSIVAVFVALTWALQRSWKTAAVRRRSGFLFILNQGYWEETTESLTLVLSACVVCMGVGVPIGIAAAHRPRSIRAMRPVLDLMQTLPTFVYLIPAIVFFGIGMVPGLIATVIFVLPAPIRLTHLGVSLDARRPARGGAGVRRDAAPDAVEDRAALCPAADHGGAEPDDHAVAVDGGDRGAGRAPTGWACRWCARSTRSTPALGFESGSRHRGRRHHARPDAAGGERR